MSGVAQNVCAHLKRHRHTDTRAQREEGRGIGRCQLAAFGI